MEQENLFGKRIVIMDVENKRQILVDGKLYMNYELNDCESERFAIVI